MKQSSLYWLLRCQLLSPPSTIVTRYLVIMKDCAALNISGKLPCVILTSGTHHQYPASTEKQYTVSIQLSPAIVPRVNCFILQNATNTRIPLD